VNTSFKSTPKYKEGQHVLYKRQLAKIVYVSLAGLYDLEICVPWPKVVTGVSENEISAKN
jgi:hypothetical protein